MPEWLIVALATLASYRLVRLVTLDRITEPVFEPLRQWFEVRWIRRHTRPGSDAEFDAVESDEWNSKLAYLLSCAWCLGLWVSGAVTMILSTVYGLDYPILVWLSMSTVIGFLGNIDSD